MIDHVSLGVSDLAKSKQFYQDALAPLGYEVVMFMEGIGAGLGRGGKPDFWITPGGPNKPSNHVAFAADNRAMVDAFHAAAMAAGATDHGAPGVRAHYHPNYYGAFVLDPDGHNIEAVCHKPE